MLVSRVLYTLRLFGLQHTAITLLELQRYLIAEPRQLLADLNADGELRIEMGEESQSTNTVENISEMASGQARLPGLWEIYNVLEQLQTEDRVVAKYGLFALKGNERHIIERWQGHFFAGKRERRIRKFSKGLRYVPFVEAVGLAGSQALGRPAEQSDIDLLILTKPGWLWLPRTLVTLYFQILGVRRHGQKIRDRFCLNHYISATKIFTQNRNWYTALEYSKLRPLTYPEALAEFQENNGIWINRFYPAAAALFTSRAENRNVQRIAERIFDNAVGKMLEQGLKRWQIKRIRLADPHTAATEDELFFSPHSKADRINPEFMQIIGRV